MNRQNAKIENKNVRCTSVHNTPTSHEKAKNYSTHSNEVPTDSDSLSSCNSLNASVPKVDGCPIETENLTDLNLFVRRRGAKRLKWEEEEKKAVFKYFGHLKKLEKLPSIKQCADVIKTYPVLSNRTAPQIKTWIDNQRRCRKK